MQHFPALFFLQVSARVRQTALTDCAGRNKARSCLRSPHRKQPMAWLASGAPGIASDYLIKNIITLICHQLSARVFESECNERFFESGMQ